MKTYLDPPTILHRSSTGRILRGSQEDLERISGGSQEDLRRIQGGSQEDLESISGGSGKIHFRLTYVILSNETPMHNRN